MKAILLAAGFGTRLRPITNELPKCLVSIKGKPLLQYWLEMLFASGIDRVLINTHYLAKKVEVFVAQSPWSAQIDLVNEIDLLGTGGTIVKNQNFFMPDDILVGHADNLTKFDVEAFIGAHKSREKDIEITMMTFITDDPFSCGVVVENKNGIVVEFHEKVSNPPSNIANAAVYILSPTVISWMSTLKYDELDFSKQVLPRYLGKIQTYLNTSYHRDIGTPSSLAIAEKEFNV
jgi:mannose-1-phosphate guanylyltransferase